MKPYISFVYKIIGLVVTVALTVGTNNTHTRARARQRPTTTSEIQLLLLRALMMMAAMIYEFFAKVVFTVRGHAPFVSLSLPVSHSFHICVPRARFHPYARCTYGWIDSWLPRIYCYCVHTHDAMCRYKMPLHSESILKA